MHKISTLEYVIKYENFQVPKCVICGKDAKKENSFHFCKTCGSKECFSKIHELNKPSKETRQKISQKRFAYFRRMKVNTGWRLHRHYKESLAEQNVRELLEKIKDIHIKQFYVPPESERGFEIDFALVERKIGLEINGSQHYNRDGTFTEYHKTRKEYLEGIRWKIIDIDYKVCFDKTRLKEIINNVLGRNIEFAEQKCNEVLNYRLEQKRQIERKKEEYRKIVFNNKILKRLKKQKLENEQELFEKLDQQWQEKYHQYQQKLTEQKKIILDVLSKNENDWGIRGKIAEVLNIHHSKVHCILKRLGLNDHVKTHRKDRTPEEREQEIRMYKQKVINNKIKRQQEKDKKEDQLFEQMKPIIDEFGNRRGIVSEISKRLTIDKQIAIRICKQRGTNIVHHRNESVAQR